MMKRTVLYYPYIQIPNGSWLRQSLLYSDEIASIVPNDLKESINNIEYIKLLKDEFRPISPQEPRKNNEFQNNFKDLITLSEFNVQLSNNHTPKQYTNIHIQKFEFLFPEIKKDLINRHLMKHNNDDWWLWEENTGNLFMALLAQYLSDDDSEFMIPSTDFTDYYNLIYRGKKDSKMFNTCGILLNNVLPVPRNDVDLIDIIDFKHDRNNRTELLRFRERINKFEEDISKADSEKRIKEICLQFQEDIELNINILSRTLEDSKIPIVLGSIENLFNLKNPDLLVGLALLVQQIPIELKVAGVAFYGIVRLFNYNADRWIQNRASIGDNRFSYLYHAKKEGII